MESSGQRGSKPSILKWLVWAGAVFLVMVTLAGAGVYFFKNDLSQYAVIRYLRDRGIQVELDIKKISLSEVVISDLIIEDKIIIPDLRLAIDHQGQGLGVIRSVAATIEVLDVAALQQVLQKLRDPGAPSSAVDFASLSETCRQIDAMHLDVHLKQVVWQKLALPLQAHLRDQTLSFELESLKPLKSSQASVDSLQTRGRVVFNCAEDLIDVGLFDFSLDVRELTTQIDSPPIKKIAFSAKKSQAGLRKDDRLEAAVQLQNLIYETDKKITTEIIEAALEPSALRFPFRGKLQLKNGGVDGMETLRIAGVNASGSFDLQEDLYTWVADITDRTKTLDLRKIQMSYQPSRAESRVIFKKNISHLNLNPDMSDFYPPLKNYVQTASGEVFLEGDVRYKEGVTSGRLALDGKDVSMVSEYGTLTHLDFHHDFKNLPGLSSSADRSFKVDQVLVGPVFRNLGASYRVVDRDRIEVNVVRVEYETAKLETSSFKVNLKNQSVEGLHAKVIELSLEKLLALGLKNAVAAEGILTGTVVFNVENKIPRIEGRLVANAPGWIRYRTTAEQKKSIGLSDNPMDILNGYLYNYYYKTLQIDIRTDDQYKMVMVLSTEGHNPDYLQGKPLKLKINLEQNLLAAFQSMMLTYNLPEKLKDRFEKAGNQ